MDQCEVEVPASSKQRRRDLQDILLAAWEKMGGAGSGVGGGDEGELKTIEGARARCNGRAFGVSSLLPMCFRCSKTEKTTS